MLRIVDGTRDVLMTPPSTCTSRLLWELVAPALYHRPYFAIIRVSQHSRRSLRPRKLNLFPCVPRWLCFD